METFLCPWEPARLLFFSENVPPLLFYSHFTAVVAALAVGAYIYFKNKNDINSKLLILLFAIFSFWTIIDVVIWATNRTDVVIFWWSMQILTEPIIYAVAFYLFYSFTQGRLPGFKTNLFTGAILLPLIVLVPTRLNLEGIYIAYCDAVEGPLALYYTYFLEILFIFAILAVSFKSIRALKGRADKLKITYFTAGIIIFLLAMTSGNIIGSITENWDVAQYGLFGMPIFVGLLAYIMAHYKAFKVKVFGTQVLVVGLWIVVGAILFVQDIGSIRVVIFLTLAMAFFSGIALIRSVRREIEQRERLEEVTKALGDANTKLKKADQLKSEFLSFASHDLKSPVAKMKQWASLVRDGTIADKDKILETAMKIEHTGDNALRLVEEFLNIRKIEEGQMEYNFEEVDFVDFVKGTKESFDPIAEERGLDLIFESSAKKLPLKIDKIKIRQVIENLLENSLKYTEKGKVKITLEEEEKSALIKIEDTGLGIDKDILHTLFEQFHRAPGEAKKIKGTGLGLYIAKQIVKAHHGEIWAESDGEGKGSRFFVRLPK